jgi:alpha-L-rhamnosidase
MILLQIEEWFHNGLAGIRQAPGSVGYRQLVIDPRVVGDLSEVEAHYDTPHGKVAVDWVRNAGSFRMTLEVPPNTTAEVRVPTGGDAAHVTADGATLDRIDGDRAVYKVQAGSYVFTARDVQSSLPRSEIR